MGRKQEDMYFAAQCPSRDSDRVKTIKGERPGHH